MLEQVHTAISDQYIVILSGELDFSEAEKTGRLLREAVSCSPLVIVDLAQLTFMDCAGIRVLEEARLAAQVAGGDLTVINAKGIPRRIMTLLGIPFQDLLPAPLPEGKQEQPEEQGETSRPDREQAALTGEDPRQDQPRAGSDSGEDDPPEEALELLILP